MPLHLHWGQSLHRLEIVIAGLIVIRTDDNESVPSSDLRKQSGQQLFLSQ